MEKITDIKDISVGKSGTPFWGTDPNVLVQGHDLFPSPALTETQNLNATTRLVLLLTLLLFFLYRNVTIILMAAITMFFIYLYHYVFMRKKREAFENPNTEAVRMAILQAAGKQLFEDPTALNPFGNVLNADIQDHPNKRPAPPVEESQDQILIAAKQAMVDNNPTFPDIDKRLLKNLGDQFEFEQSMQPFYSNPATTIPNDQNAFADFCYGSMISCKEGNLFACARNSDEAIHYGNY